MKVALASFREKYSDQYPMKVLLVSILRKMYWSVSYESTIGQYPMKVVLVSIL